MSKYEPIYQSSNNLHRNASGTLNYSPNHWKQHVVAEVCHKKREEVPSRQNKSYQPQNFLPSFETPSRVEKKGAKEDILKRVKQLQEKVLPLIENQHNQRLDEGLETKTKLQQKIGKLETNIDFIEKDLNLKWEKKILELEKKFTNRFNQLEEKLNL